MKRDEVVQRLKAQRSQFIRFNVKSLALFGSVARDEARPDSDVDILVDFNGPATFDQYMTLKDFLQSLLGHPVDLLTRKSIRPELAPYVEQDTLHVA